MHRIITLALLAGLLPATLTGSPAQAALPWTGPSIAVIGGSMTASFSADSGSRSQGWWSIAAERVGATSVKTSAERQSSISTRGIGCQGTTYTDRLRYLERVDIVIIEAGNDDHRTCTPNGRRAGLTRAKQKAAIARYTRALGQRVDKLKIPRSHVFFVMPRVPASGTRAANLRKDLRLHAGPEREGFRIISTKRLSRSQTARGVLPNQLGNIALGQQVASAIAPVAKKSRSRAPARGPGPSIMLYGDSIVSFYTSDPGSRAEGWWSMAARQLNASSVRTSAEMDSGANSHGNGCDGTTFGERLRHLRPVDILIVEVGRNDYKQCTSRTATRFIDPPTRRAGIDRYVRALSERVTELGIDPHNVYLVTPWGSRDAHLAPAIQSHLESAATAPEVGFTYIRTPVMNDALTYDRVHPNLRGNQWLAGIVTRAIWANTGGGAT